VYQSHALVRPAMVLAALVLVGCTSAGGSSVPGAPSSAPSSLPAVVSPSASPAASPQASAGDCVSQTADYPADASGLRGDPVELARASLSGLDPNDDLSAKADETGTVVSVARDGTAIGRVHFVQDADGGWLLDTAVLCADLGWADRNGPPTAPSPSVAEPSLPVADAPPPVPLHVTATKDAALCPGETEMSKFPCITARLEWDVAPGTEAVYRIYEAYTGEGPGASCDPIDAHLLLTTDPGVTSALVGPLEPATGGGDRCLFIAAANTAGESARVTVPGGFMVLP
jgi:hypothetical protein